MTPATTANNTFNIVSLTANEDSESEIKYFESHELTKAVEYEDVMITFLFVRMSILM
jgi:cobaltochelatase CobS